MDKSSEKVNFSEKSEEQKLTKLSNYDKFLSSYGQSRHFDVILDRPTTKSLNFQKVNSCSISSDDIYCESLDSNNCSLSICDSESYTETASVISDDKVLGPLKCDLETGYEDTSPKKAKRLKKTKNQKFNRGGNLISFRPNYFIGIQISNPDIHKTVLDVQKSLLAANIDSAPSLIDVATLHITLLVAHIQDDTQLYEACSALDYCGSILSEELLSTPLQLSFKGVSNFSHKTLFAKLVEDHHYVKLLHIGHIINKRFSEMNITMPDRKDMTPHLTIAKLSKLPKGQGKPVIRKIDPGHYQHFLNYEFGTQTVSGIQLLSMNKPKDLKRYYFSSREVSFDVVPVESLDHTNCCFPRQPQKPKLYKAESSQNIFVSFINDNIMKAVIGGAAIMSMVFILSKVTVKIVGS